MTPQQHDAWQRFCDETGHGGTPAYVGPFGDGPELADELLALTLDGRKQATCALTAWYERQNLPLPVPGDLSLILDGAGQPRCVIRTTRILVAPFSSGDAAFAHAEGEGDGSLAWWRDAHIDYFNREGLREGFTFTEDMPVVFEHFACIWTV